MDALDPTTSTLDAKTQIALLAQHDRFAADALKALTAEVKQLGERISHLERRFILLAIGGAAGGVGIGAGAHKLVASGASLGLFGWF